MLLFDSAANKGLSTPDRPNLLVNGSFQTWLHQGFEYPVGGLGGTAAFNDLISDGWRTGDAQVTQSYNHRLDHDPSFTSGFVGSALQLTNNVVGSNIYQVVPQPYQFVGRDMMLSFTFISDTSTAQIRARIYYNTFDAGSVSNTVISDETYSLDQIQEGTKEYYDRFNIPFVVPEGLPNIENQRVVDKGGLVIELSVVNASHTFSVTDIHLGVTSSPIEYSIPPYGVDRTYSSYYHQYMELSSVPYSGTFTKETVGIPEPDETFIDLIYPNRMIEGTNLSFQLGNYTLEGAASDLTVEHIGSQVVRLKVSEITLTGDRDWKVILTKPIISSLPSLYL